jgi:hypothetical protein
MPTEGIIMKKTTNKKRTAPATISAGTAEQSTSSEIFAAIGFQSGKEPEKSRELVFEGTHSDFRVSLVPEPIWYQVDAAEQAMYAAYNAGREHERQVLCEEFKKSRRFLQTFGLKIE